jgi:hypothetical protein
MLESRTQEMRKAAAAGEWSVVMRLWEDYTGGIRAELGLGACTGARLTEAREFIDWSQRVALCARAQTQQRLDAIHAARQYDRQPDRPRHSVRASL